MNNGGAIATATAGEDAGAPTSMPPPVTDDSVHERKRSILALILRHLRDHGLAQSYQTLCAEARMSLNQVRRERAASREFERQLRLRTGVQELPAARVWKRPRVIERPWASSPAARS